MHMVFVDFEKVYDQVPRSVVWEVLKRRGVQGMYMRIVKDMHTGVMNNIKTRMGCQSFEMKVGVP